MLTGNLGYRRARTGAVGRRHDRSTALPITFELAVISIAASRLLIGIPLGDALGVEAGLAARRRRPGGRASPGSSIPAFLLGSTLLAYVLAKWFRYNPNG